MTAEELQIGYSLKPQFKNNVIADEDVFAEAAGTIRRPLARRPLARRPAPIRATSSAPAGIFQRGGLTGLYTKLGGGIKDIIKGAQQNRALKQKAKLAEAQGMAKALQESAKSAPQIKEKDNTIMYVLIGVGALALIGGVMYFIKKGKK